jgi:hypothetical protein
LKDLLRASLVDTNSGKEPATGGFKTDDGEDRPTPIIMLSGNTPP